MSQELLKELTLATSHNRESHWKVIDTGIRSASENMALDAELLDSLDQYSHPILHLYDWKHESATYGHFVNPADFLNLDEAHKRGLDLAKRSTGGGIVFHIWDLAFSVLVPANNRHFSENTLENYAFVNECVLNAVKNFLGSNQDPTLIPTNAVAFDVSCERFCMAQPTKYDVVLNGKKIAGAAQRKTKKGFLHQGTIALKMPSVEYLKAVLLPGTKVVEAMLSHTYPLLGPGEDLQEGRRALQKELITSFTREDFYVK